MQPSVPPAPLVSVHMLTYNHEPFIAQAIEGVLTQKTNFPLELVIGEDRSTDGTRRIVEHYANAFPWLIRPMFQPRNLGAHANFFKVLESCRGEFIAFCEGDDYWTSPQKLQRQIDFLFAHPDCVLCCHRAHALDDQDPKVDNEEPPPDHREAVHDLEMILAWNVVVTCTAVIRRSALPQIPEGFEGLRLGDWPFWILAARGGNIGYLDEQMAVHRIHAGGVWTSMLEHERQRAAAEMYQFVSPHLPGRHRLQARRLSAKKLAVSRHLALFQGIDRRSGRGKAASAAALAWAVLKNPSLIVWRPFWHRALELCFRGWNRPGASRETKA